MDLYQDCSNYSPGVKMAPACFTTTHIEKVFKRLLLRNLCANQSQISHAASMDGDGGKCVCVCVCGGGGGGQKFVRQIWVP